jgi:hypothetical protein
MSVPVGIKVMLVYDSSSMDHYMPALIQRPQMAIRQHLAETTIAWEENGKDRLNCREVAEILLPA